MLVHKGGKIKKWGGECRDVTPTKSLSQNIRVDVNKEVIYIYFFFRGGGQVGGVGFRGGHFFWGGGGGLGGGGRGGGAGSGWGGGSGWM